MKTLVGDAGESSTIGEEVKNMYQIHEVCERCHLSRKAVRLYEEKGLLHPGRIQGNRIYNKEDVLHQLLSWTWVFSGTDSAAVAWQQ